MLRVFLASGDQRFGEVLRPFRPSPSGGIAARTRAAQSVSDLAKQIPPINESPVAAIMNNFRLASLVFLPAGQNRVAAKKENGSRRPPRMTARGLTCQTRSREIPLHARKITTLKGQYVDCTLSVELGVESRADPWRGSGACRSPRGCGRRLSGARRPPTGGRKHRENERRFTVASDAVLGRALLRR